MFIDIPSAEQLGITLIEPGLYKAMVTRTETKMTSKGDLMISVEYTIEDSVFGGRKVYDNLVINEGGLRRLARVVKSLTNTNLPEGRISVDELALKLQNMIIHKTGIIRVVIESYNDIERNKVADVRPIAMWLS